ILAREQDRRALVARLVQRELGIQRPDGVVHAGLAAIEVAPLVEQIRPEAGSLDRFQELFRNDGVGVDVRPIERGHETAVNREAAHGNVRFGYPGAGRCRTRPVCLFGDYFFAAPWMDSPAFSMSLP